MGEIKGDNAKKFAKRANKKDFTDMIKKDILPLLDLDKNTKVADLGTGSGNIIPFFINKVKEFAAVEPSPEMVNILKENYKEKNLRIINNSAYDTGLKDSEFDVVITKFALHHMKDAEAVFSESLRIMKPNGKFVVIDMVFSSSFLIKMIEPFWKLNKAIRQGWHELHCVYRNRNEIYKAAEKTGFKIVKEKFLLGNNSYRDKHYPAYIFIMES